MAYADDKLKLQTNIPETIALEFDRGLPVSGNYGDQVLFTLTDGRKWYAPPFVAAKIEAAGIPAGVFFTLTKKEIVEGNRRRVEYQIGDAPFNSAPRNNGGRQTAVKATAGVVQTPAAVPVNPRIASSSVDLPSQHSAPAPSPAPAVEGSSAVALLKMAGCGAIDAVLAIEQYAADRGLTDFSFGVDNIQRLAACLFIEMQKRAGRAA